MLSPQNANKYLLSLSVICAGLLAIIVVLYARTKVQPHELLDVALENPEVRQAVIEALVGGGAGLIDSHADPDVAYTLQPDIPSKRWYNTGIRTNELGMRERPYTIPKPENMIRVVLLGDSYVVGLGVAEDERCGVFLEEYLQENSQVGDVSIECLHIGAPSWNILAECAYLRRQLADLSPDLVVHVVVPNDLDDIAGVRGFGRRARFSPHHRDRAASMISREYPRFLGFHSLNPLLNCLDYESRQRYAEAGDAMADLVEDLHRIDCPYLLLLNWMKFQSIGLEQFSRVVDDSSIVMLPYLLATDPAYYVARNDRHWNPNSHRLIAQMLYHLIQNRGLLPALSLPRWVPAEKAARFLQDEARREVVEAGEGRELYPPDLASAITFTELSEETARAIYGGFPALRRPSLVGPYASIILARGEGLHLRVEGEYLPNRSLCDATVEIYCEDVPVKTLTIVPGQPFSVEEAIPAQLLERPYLNIRLLTDDYVYLTEDFQKTVSLEVHRISIQ
jgi:hypothetical protein